MPLSNLLLPSFSFLFLHTQSMLAHSTHNHIMQYTHPGLASLTATSTTACPYSLTWPSANFYVFTLSFSLSLSLSLSPSSLTHAYNNVQILSGPVSTWALFSASSVLVFTEGLVFTSPRSAPSTWTSGTRQVSTSCSLRATTSQTATTRRTWAMGCLKQTPQDHHRMLQSEWHGWLV